MKTCGECFCFKPVPPERGLDGIPGDGWCMFNPPIDMIDFGRGRQAIASDRPACSLGPLLATHERLEKLEAQP
jgi:hypothetical protein